MMMHWSIHPAGGRMNHGKSDNMPKKTLEQLQETHSEMLATAADLGLEIPQELQLDFTDARAGETIVKSIDALIREHRSKDKSSETTESADAKKPVAEDDEKGQTEEVKPPKAAKKPKSAAKKSGTANKTPKAAEQPSTSNKEKTEVAKATKKTAAKKASKKAATANARTRTKFDETKKIVKVGDNPCREGSGKFNRVANVLRHTGKTVKTYLTTGKGKGGTLSWCVKNKVVKVA